MDSQPLNQNIISPWKRSSRKGFELFGYSKNIPTKDIVAKVKTAVKNLPIAEAGNVRAKTSLVLYKASPPEDNLSKKKAKTSSSLSERRQRNYYPSSR